MDGRTVSLTDTCLLQCQFPDAGGIPKGSSKDQSGSAGDSRDDTEESESDVHVNASSVKKGKGKRRANGQGQNGGCDTKE